MILFVLFICLIVYSAELKANSNIVNIDIYGYTYQAVIIENAGLKNKVSGIELPGTAKHYKGFIVGFEDSWVRVSNIEGKWQGALHKTGKGNAKKPDEAEEPEEEPEDTDSEGEDGPMWPGLESLLPVHHMAGLWKSTNK